MPTVSVKWQKEVFPAVEIDTSQLPLAFKCQLYGLTGVPPERQKIMVKGGLLKDDADWNTLGLKEGQRLMMMGTADEVVKAPENGPVFVEDLPEEEQVATVGHTAGLSNLGETCYMNSTIQCLHSVPELKSALQKYTYSGRSNDLDPLSHLLTVAIRDLFGELDRSVRPVAPMQFWMALRKKYPQFSQQHNGLFMQQDAEECWTQIIDTLSESLKSPDSRDNVEAVKALFGIELMSKVRCGESGEESSETESVYSLKCHISHEVNHLHDGLKQGLKSELEKASPALGRNAVYLKESRVNSLPSYLTVQFVRFFWKRKSNQKAKILRKVDYPLELDVFYFCSDELREKLKEPRQILRDQESVKFGLISKENQNDSKDKNVGTSNAEVSNTNSSSDSNAAEGKQGMDTDKKKQLTGIYNLVAVLTHKGRSADSGHYVAWVKQENGKWIEFDDDNPIPQREEDITKLSGGGDWHMAYILLYKARTLITP
uniref:ubiquitinyl hydrolase 1 n=1 Tax=Araucaria cunninghamii TaxID=56994 RepID=A0A0D6QSB9_ARACU